ncbi:HLA class I histocompatibility antigen, B-37 alpha chain, partial [Galemys pyrenaicus]
MPPPTFPLLLLGALVQTESWAGSHSITYLHTLVSRPGLGEPRFIFVAYVDDTQFLRFDSHDPSPKVESTVRWMEQESSDYWRSQKHIVKGHVQYSKVRLSNLQKYYNQSETEVTLASLGASFPARPETLTLFQFYFLQISCSGSHTLQVRNGCEVGLDGHLSLLNEFAYDGIDYLTLKEQLRRTQAGKEVQLLEDEWNEIIAHEIKNPHLEWECKKWLQGKLKKGNQTLHPSKSYPRASPRAKAESSRGEENGLKARYHPSMGP